MKYVRVLVPLLTLLGCLIGWIAARVAKREPVLVETVEAPRATLAPLAFAPREAALAGRVVTTDGIAVADALVWVRAKLEPQWAYTGADGRFRLEALEAGPWSACVLARGFMPQKFAIGALVEDATITLEKPVGPPPRLPPIARSNLHGRTSGGVIEDLSGYEIVLTPLEAPQTLGAPVPRRVQAGQDGEFAVDALAEGEYGVRVLPPWARGGSWPDLLRPLDSSGMQPFVHARDRDPLLELALVSGALRGTLVDAAGAPIEGALVLLAPSADPARLWPPASTAADGAFAADDLPPGLYKVSVRAGADTSEHALEIRPGEVLTCTLRL